MTTPVPAPATSPWFDEGLRAGAVLDTVTSVLVAGRDGDAAAWVALGLARAQATRRRVAVADLIGEAYALALPEDADDAPGIADSFAYGPATTRYTVLPFTARGTTRPPGAGSVRRRNTASASRSLSAAANCTMNPRRTTGCALAGAASTGAASTSPAAVPPVLPVPVVGRT